MISGNPTAITGGVQRRSSAKRDVTTLPVYTKLHPVMEYPRKLTNAYTHPANVGFCNFTGCSVISPPEWRIAEPTYAVAAGLMDDHIVFSLPWGRGSVTGMQRYVTLMHHILDHHIGQDRRIVLVDDFSQYHGIHRRARRIYIDGLKHRPEIAGLVCYNLSTYFRFNLGIGRRLHRVPFPIEFCDNYEEAIICAARILNTPIGCVNPDDLAPTSTARHNLEKAYPLLNECTINALHVAYRRAAQDTLLIHCTGTLTIEAVTAFVKRRRAAATAEWPPEQCRYIILNIENLHQLPLQVVEHYARLLGNDLPTTSTKLLVVVGENVFTNASLHFTKTLIPIPVTNAVSLDIALDIVACHRSGSAVPLNLPLPAPGEIVTKTDLVQTLLRILSHTYWEIPGMFKIAECYPPDDDLRHLLDALDTIKMDQDMMLADYRQQIRQLAQATDVIEGSEQQFRALFEVAANGILVIDSDGVIVDSNPAAATVFRISTSGLIGEHATTFLPSIESYRRDFPNRPENGIDDVQITAYRKQRKPFPARVSLRCIATESGTHTIVYVRDCTDSLAVQQAVLDTSMEVTRRIGCDLHDSLGQKLVGTFYLCQALRKTLENEKPALAKQAESILEVLQNAIAETRNLARGLNPSDQTGGGFLSQLARFATDSETMYNITCKQQSTLSEPNIPEKTGMHLYHIVQESVNNAVRHGKASSIVIRVTKQDAITGLLSITDNGTGFAKATQGNGMGLRLMRYRSNLIGGEFDAQSTVGKGVTLTCTFALTPSPR